jgi:uncharacterized protein with GYD domain
MAFYLYKASYTSEAIKAMVGKPEDREAAARKVIEALGGTLHHFFFALGDDDIIAILEAPDDATVAAGSMVVGASGSFSNISTTKLLTMAEAMAAMGKANAVVSAYAAPGG